jgi:nicotinamidase-related amidase
MSLPKTLLEMAGANTSPPAWEDAVLVLIDCQQEYVDGALALPGVAPALKECAQLLTMARAAGAPVVHVVHHGPAGGGMFDPEGPSGAEAAEVTPVLGETIVAKALPNAFAGTDLHAVLEATGRTALVIAGFMTHMCVSSTARVAMDLGYSNTVVDTACATRDLPDGQGGVLAAEDLHRAALVALSDRFALIVKDASAWDA